MRQLVPAVLLLVLASSAPVEARKNCKKGEISTSDMCVACNDHEIAQNNRCVACPQGKVPDAQHASCVQAPPGRRCEPGHISTGGMCMPCDGDDIAKNNHCVACPAGQRPDSKHASCVGTGKKLPCAPGWIHSGTSGRLCVPCKANEIVRNDACIRCGLPLSPDKLKLSCVRQAPPPSKCPAAEKVSIERFGQYQNGVASLPKDQRDAIDALAARIARSQERGCTPITTVTLVGHSDHDASVTAAFELDVSRKRAAAVKDELVKKLGAKGRSVRFDASGLGSKNLKYPRPANATQMLENRRVVVTTQAGRR